MQESVVGLGLAGQAICRACYASKVALSLGCADIGACESIMKKKTKQDFQEMIKAEHCEYCSLSRICCCSCPSPPTPALHSNPLATALGSLTPGCPLCDHSPSRPFALGWVLRS